MSSSICSSLCYHKYRRNPNVPGRNHYTATRSWWFGKGLLLFISNLCTLYRSSCSPFSLSYIFVCCMHAAAGLFSWSMGLLAFASGQFAPNYGPLSASFTWFYFIISLWARVADGSRPRTKRLVCHAVQYHVRYSIVAHRVVLHIVSYSIVSYCSRSYRFVSYEMN